MIATAPIVEPVKDVICVGLNYQAHVNESQSLRITDNKEDIHTTYFGKRCDYIRGDQEPVIIWSDVDPEMDYEAELAIVIGKGVEESVGPTHFLMCLAIASAMICRREVSNEIINSGFWAKDPTAIQQWDPVFWSTQMIRPANLILSAV